MSTEAWGHKKAQQTQDEIKTPAPWERVSIRPLDSHSGRLPSLTRVSRPKFSAQQVSKARAGRGDQ